MKLTEKYNVIFVDDYDMCAETEKSLREENWKKVNWELFEKIINRLAKR